MVFEKEQQKTYKVKIPIDFQVYNKNYVCWHLILLLLSKLYQLGNYVAFYSSQHSTKVMKDSSISL
jgi:hypothetical protein